MKGEKAESRGLLSARSPGKKGKKNNSEKRSLEMTKEGTKDREKKKRERWAPGKRPLRHLKPEGQTAVCQKERRCFARRDGKSVTVPETGETSFGAERERSEGGWSPRQQVGRAGGGGQEKT